MDEKETITEIFEDIKEQMCDSYCKYPEKINADDDEQWDKMNEICGECPLNRL